MVATPAVDNVAIDRTSGRLAVEAILNSYAIIFFGRHRGLGAALLVATFLVPQVGLFGLAGVAMAFAAARWFGFNDAGVRSGELLFNSLLVSLALAVLADYRQMSPALLVILLAAASLAALLLSVAFQHAMRNLLGLPVLSIPFVIITVCVYQLIYIQSATPVAAVLTCVIPEPTWLPVVVTQYFLSFGGVLFLPWTPIGIVVCGALLCYSRLLVLMATVGFASGWLFLHLTHVSAIQFGVGWLGANFVLCGIALGSIFYVPSRDSLLLAAIGPAFCALVAIGMSTLLWSFAVPPLSLPFILVVYGMVIALRQREQVRGVFENPYADVTPEASVRRFHSALRRFPDTHLPAIFLPFAGARVVTQGFNSTISHVSWWRHALDFEMLDGHGDHSPPQRHALEDNYTFGSPVLAPCDGTVVKVVNHVVDNPLGTENLRENWGNYVVLATDGREHVALCHFKQNGVVVATHQRVSRGQLLGHCGNSGRSPLPHLHMQMQASNRLGAATIPFRIRNYITAAPNAVHSFQLRGVPNEGARIRPLMDDKEIAACFDACLRTRIRFRVESDGKPVGSETIETRLTELGDVLFRSLERATTLRATMSDGAFIAQDLEGHGGGFLSMLRIGLSLVPFSRDRDIHWHDSFDPRPLRTAWAGWTADICEPFFGIRFIPLHQHFANAHVPDEIAMTTEIGGASTRIPGVIPRQIDVRLSRDRGLMEMTVTNESSVVRFVAEMREQLAVAD